MGTFVMGDEITHAYAGSIVKTETTPDGDLLVYGKATGIDLDLDEQVADPGWLRKAMPEWAQWGNVREQHQAIAAGVGMQLDEDGTDWHLKSMIVDKGTAEKIRKGVLKGYSIGIKGAVINKDANARGGRIVGGKIVEISVVDRPCNPTATIDIAKAFGAEAALGAVDTAGVLLTKLDGVPAPVTPVVTDTPATDDAGVDDDPTPMPKPRKRKTRVTGVMAPRARTAAMKTVAAVLAGELAEQSDMLVKAIKTNDETKDISGAKNVLGQIADLIISEATELKNGRLEELWDIETLMGAARAMRSFLRAEQGQDGQPSGVDDPDAMTYVGLAANGETTKTTKKAAKMGKKTKGIEPTPATEIDKVDKAAGAPHDGGAEIDIRKAVTEATGPLEAMIKSLQADLAKVQATPVPGGPYIMPVNTTVTATTAPNARLALGYRDTANKATDPGVSAAYRALADKVEGDA